MKKTYRKSEWESHLIRESQNGSLTAFELLVDEFREAVFHHAKRQVGDREDALDITQETFVKAYRAMPRFDPERPILPWLLRICKNCSTDHLRSRKAPTVDIETTVLTLADGQPDPEEVAGRTETARLVRKALRRLPQIYQQILQMRHFEQLEVSEIALRLHKPEGTIKSWLFRARTKLRQELQSLA